MGRWQHTWLTQVTLNMTETIQRKIYTSHTLAFFVYLFIYINIRVLWHFYLFILQIITSIFTNHLYDLWPQKSCMAPSKQIPTYGSVSLTRFHSRNLSMRVGISIEYQSSTQFSQHINCILYVHYVKLTLLWCNLDSAVGSYNVSAIAPSSGSDSGKEGVNSWTFSCKRCMRNKKRDKCQTKMIFLCFLFYISEVRQN